MLFSQPITEIIQHRFSCRSYQYRPIDETLRQKFLDTLAEPQVGPGGSVARFALVAASKDHRRALKGLGTYGFIRGASGFVVGAVGQAQRDLEDYGYLLERLILFATDLGLGTCWLGGSFTRSSFTRAIAPSSREHMPAVISIGPIADAEQSQRAFLRRRLKADRRLPWERLFFQQRFGLPLEYAKSGGYASALEMVRLGPSASNRQPWRILQNDNSFHFYLQRTPGYRVNPITRLLTIADLQRVDMGIAMCHFELTAHELGLGGGWAIQDPGIETPGELTEYSVSWMG